MANLVEVVEGWTDTLEFTLKADDVAVNLTGLTVTLNLRNEDGVLVEYDSEVSADPDQVTNPGVVYFDPPADTFLAVDGPYRARFKVTDGTDIVFFPNAVAADLILVGKP